MMMYGMKYSYTLILKVSLILNSQILIFNKFCKDYTFGRKKLEKNFHTTHLKFSFVIRKKSTS